MIAWWCHHSVIMADFLMPETQQTIIVIILVIHSSYFKKLIVEHTCTCIESITYSIFAYSNLTSTLRVCLCIPQFSHHI